ncbi:206_t:CDS:2, partial [Racocetra fulgida]
MDDATKSAFDVFLSGIIPLGYTAIFEPMLSANVKNNIDDIFIILYLVIIPADDIYVKIGLNINLLMLTRLPGIIAENPYTDLDNNMNPDEKANSDGKRKPCFNKRGLVSIILFGINEDNENVGENNNVEIGRVEEIEQTEEKGNT